VTAALIKTSARGVHASMERDIKKDDIVEVWTGAAIGSPYPPRPGDPWLEARVVEVKGGSFQIAWTGTRPGMPWVPRAAIRRPSV
jgi:hypothetical protein